MFLSNNTSNNTTSVKAVSLSIPEVHHGSDLSHVGGGCPHIIDDTILLLIDGSIYILRKDIHLVVEER